MLDGPPSPEFSCIDGSNVYGICPAFMGPMSMASVQWVSMLLCITCSMTYASPALPAGWSLLF